MADTVRTRAGLITQRPNNLTGLISEQADRDLVESAFGYVAITDPGVNNDSVDTAGIGAFFDSGSRWTNTLTLVPWFCVAGTPTVAVWVALEPPDNFVVVSASDTTPGPLLIGLHGKLDHGDHIEFSLLNPGGDERVKIDVPISTLYRLRKLAFIGAP
jgi:hypothetical protein